MSYLYTAKLKEVLREKTGLGYLNGSQNELICRCPFPDCELEQRRFHNHGRLYIDVNKPVFFCFRCNRSGSIFKLLNTLGLKGDDYLDRTNEVFQSSGIGNYDTTSVVAVDNFNKLKISKVSSDRYFKKVDYLKGRLGFDIDVERIPNLLLNVKDFIRDNNIKLNDKDKMNLDIYDEKCVGFITNRGTTIILRQIDGSEYHKIKITESGELRDFFGVKVGPIKNSINRIVVTEGVFDLLVGLSEPLLNDLKTSSCFWGAALGSFYHSMIPSILNYIKVPYVDVVVLSDRDKKEKDFIYKKLSQSPFVRSLEIYWNKCGHDFGEKPIMPVKTSFSMDNYFVKKRREVKKCYA